MPTINPLLVPAIAPGSLFSVLTTNSSVNVRYFVASDPVFYEVLNRPIADLALRQLMVAKTLDQLNLRIGHQSLYPYLNQPKIETGSTAVDVPMSMIWDMNVSLNQRYTAVRLAKIKRISGVNGAATSGSGPNFEFTGALRLVFTARVDASEGEVAVFEADVELDTDLTYQYVRIAAPSGIDASEIDPGFGGTIGGFIIFKTLDQTDPGVQAFLNAVAPPISGFVDTNGEYDPPTIYDIQDSPAGGVTETNDFNLADVSHGTGLLLASATNAIPNFSCEETDPVYQAEKGEPFGAATLDSGGNVPASQLGNATLLETDPVYNAEKGQPNGAATLDGAGDVPLAQLGNVHSNANDPSTTEKQALAGTTGTPSNTNRYVTDQDARNTNARTPTAHKDSHKSGGSDAFASTDLLEASVIRIREAGGPTVLTMGAVGSGQFLQRSGTDIIGAASTIADGSVSFAKIKTTLLVNTTHSVSAFSGDGTYTFNIETETNSFPANPIYIVSVYPESRTEVSGASFFNWTWELGGQYTGGVGVNEVFRQRLRLIISSSAMSSNSVTMRIRVWRLELT